MRYTRKGGRYAPKEAKQRKEYIQGYVIEAMNEAGITNPITGPVGMELILFFKAPKTHKHGYENWMPKRPDGDNCAKLAQDALNKLLIEDDAQIVRLVVEKRYAYPGQERTHITIEEAGQCAI